MTAINEIPNGTYTREQLSAMTGRSAWNVHIPAEEGRERDAARAELAREAIRQIEECETATGGTCAAEIVNDEVVAIVEAE